MTKVAVVGARGRMGQEILQILLAEKTSPTAVVSKKPAIRTDSAGFAREVLLNEAGLKGHDVVIEFSNPEGFEKTIELCQKLKLPLVSGTTGLSEQQKKQLAAAAKKIPVLWAANMSLGVALLKKATQLMAGLDGFDFQIEEFHHNQKKDKPSGTAVVLQEALSAALPARNKKRLAEPVSIRGGGVIGIHRVYAISDEELLNFEHQALSRRVFASGAVRAAHWLAKKKPGLYQIEDIFNHG